jgi:hypothetical protein
VTAASPVVPFAEEEVETFSSSCFYGAVPESAMGAAFPSSDNFLISTGLISGIIIKNFFLRKS